MSGNLRRVRALSGGPLEGSTDANAEGPVTGSFDLPEHERYDDAGRLGRGGMGEVRVVVDRRLDRELALKTSLAHDAAAEARMMREAMLAARLEHPGIVPVHGAGRLPDGRLYYTMRVVRGRSLLDALSDTDSLASRLRLVRRVLDAAEAIAHAHDRGILHRDLKPANVMLAEHGETVVVDWGLAATLSSQDPGTHRPSQPGSPETEPGLPELTGAGDVFGTPAYMAPEQARGERVGTRADVFALGGMLYHVLTGHPPREDTGSTDPPAPVRSVSPRAPAELAAIADRALSDDADARYPDAGALASDLGAWFEGRPVAAHDYSVLELLRRLVRAYRGPIAVGLVAAVGLVVAIGIGMRRTIAERNRARAAESSAVEARDRSDANLARALVAQAIVAADRDDRASAELLAAHALRLGDDPRARGILARSAGRPRPRRLHVLPLPQCLEVVVDPRGERVACVSEGELRIIEPKRGASPRARLPVRALSVAFGGDAPWLGIIDHQGLLGWDLVQDTVTRLPAPSADSRLRSTSMPGVVLRLARGRATLVRAEDPAEVPGPSCPDDTRPLRSIFMPGPEVLHACAGRGGRDSQVLRIGREGATEPLLSIPVGDGPPSALAVDPNDRDRVAVGTESGRVLLHEHGRLRVLRPGGSEPSVRELALSGARLAIAGSQGGVRVLDLDQPRRSTSLPSGPASIRWMNDGHTLRVVSGDAVTDWEVPPLRWPHRFELGSGISAVAISQGGRFLGSTHGDGTLRLHDRMTGELRLQQQVGTGVAKDLAFSPDGRQVVVGSARGEEVIRFDVESGTRVDALPTARTRRLAWGTTELFVAPYAYGLTSWGPDGSRRDWPIGVQVDDLEAVVDGPGVVIIEDRRVIRRLDPTSAPDLEAPAAEVTNARAVAGNLRNTYVAAGHVVLALDAALQEVERLQVPGATIEEIALSPDGRWLAVGQLDGTLGLWRTEDWRPIAWLEGHTGRVPALAFTPRGDVLISGSWDGSLRTWDLRAIELDADAFIHVAESAWGMKLADALEH